MCSCLEGIAKYFLFVTNLIICILSLITVGLATWVLVDAPSFEEVLSADDINVYTAGVVILLVVAVSTALLACFGCCSAIKHNKCMLVTYSVILLLLLGLILTGVILAFTRDLRPVRDSMYRSLQDYDPESSNAVDKAVVDAWDELQQDFECCGVESWRDWAEENDYYSFSQGQSKIPESCCNPSYDEDACVATPSTSNGNYHVGCFKKAEDFYEENAAAIGGTAIAILVIMVLNFAISCYMCACDGSRNDDNRSRRKGYGPAKTAEY